MLTVDHKHCTGCGSCIEACPQLAVVKIRDKYKFIYPSVEHDLCTQCGRCLEVCPLDKPLKAACPAFAPRYYAAKSREKAELTDSHAGGIFTLLAKAVIQGGGIVYGCAFDENRHPHHIRADSLRELPMLRGLKPVQSDTDGLYAAVRADAENGRTVLFSGTPCQCDGLRRFLGREYDNLILVDMLCSGVTSEGIFHRYFHWLEGKLGGKISDIRFENKRAFGHSRGMRVIYRRGKFRYLLSYPAELDLLYSMSKNGYINRRSCGTCQYASPVRVGDISLGRFEKIRSAHPNFAYDNGVSLVIVSSDKGMALFEQIHDKIDCESSDFERAAANRLLTSPTPQNKNRSKLLTDIYRSGFAKAADNYGRTGFLTSAAVFLKSAFPDKAVILFDQAINKGKMSWQQHFNQ